MKIRIDVYTEEHITELMKSCHKKGLPLTKRTKEVLLQPWTLAPGSDQEKLVHIKTDKESIYVPTDELYRALLALFGCPRSLAEEEPITQEGAGF